MKFKVGDKVRVKKDLVGGVTYDGVYFGFCMEPLRGKEFIVTNIENGNYYLNDGEDYTYHESMLEPAINQPMEKLVIYRDGDKTIAKYYKGDKVVTASATCCSCDNYDFKQGVALTTESVFNKMEEEEVGYSWVKCVGYRTKDSFTFTIDKKYKIYNDGSITDDTGFTFCSKKSKREMLNFLSQFYIFEEVKPS